MFSFTIDTWTSKNTLPFMGISLHWINEDWELCNSILDFCLLSGPHSGENLANKFLEVLKEFNISKKVISFIIYFFIFLFIYFIKKNLLFIYIILLFNYSFWL